MAGLDKFFVNFHKGISILQCKPKVAKQVPMRTPSVRKQLSAAGLLLTARQVLGKIPDTNGNMISRGLPTSMTTS